MAVERLPVGLALQGGGSHGAFGWGVLEALLESEALDIRAISGTSAGAVNAFILGAGWAEGGRQGAIAALAAFWKAVAETQASLTFGLFDPTRLGLPPGDASLDANPLYVMAGLAGQFLSPYQVPGATRHPLELVFECDARFSGLHALDAEALAKAGGPSIHVTATDVVTGEAEVFGETAVTRTQVLASACLPSMSRAVHDGGRFFWDGGYSANPSLKPLMRADGVRDLLVVQVNPRDRAAEPWTAREIINRINEISFNSSLLWQTRGIERLNDAWIAVDALLEALASEPSVDAATRRRILSRVAAELRLHVAARERLARRMGRTPLSLLLPESLIEALAKAVPAAAGLDTTHLRPIAVHMIDADAPGDRGIERYTASSKLNASTWFLEELRKLGRKRAEAWLAETLPLIRESRSRGEHLSTFWHESRDRRRRRGGGPRARR
ncbi:MAG: patatin-like phospholipase family protein [Geminicoccaceae bacterium]